MDVFKLLERSGHVAPPDEVTVRGALDLVIADARQEVSTPAGTVTALRGWRRAPRRHPYLTGAAAMIALGAAVGAPISLSTGEHQSTTNLKLASYSFRLPGRYHLSTATSATCSPMLVWGETGDMTGQASTPGYASGVSASASAAGGCLTMVLAPPYTPTQEWPDPETVVSSSDGQAVQVGPYNALVRTGPVIYTAANGYGPSETILDVQIPLSGGTQQDLVVAEQGLSQSQLISLVSQGLSGTSGSPTTTS